MHLPEPSFTIGIEEEYLLVDRETRDLVSEAPKELLGACEARLEGQVSPEFLQCQIEVGTRVCTTIQEARADLAHLRNTIAEVSGQYGLAPIAASTHPFARWQEQHHTDKERYNILAKDLQFVVRRLMICGMHVHIGIEDENVRIDLFNQLAYFLPHMLALSTSSPFWQGRETGLKSYRLTVFDALPRTGVPSRFASFSEYQRTIATLVTAGLIEDATKIWWDLRPSARFPTLEARICDVCTYLDDAISIAALFACVARTLYRLRRNNQRWREYLPFLINENRWRAQRYGISEGLVDFGIGEVVPTSDLLEELISLTLSDAQHFGCVDEVAHARNIFTRGTSADRQLACYHAALEDGASDQDALKAVVDQLVRESLEGIDTTT